MKFDKPKKIVIGILSILIIWSTVIIVPKITYTIKTLKQKPVNKVTIHTMEDKECDIIKKYDLFPEIFKYDEPVFVYGYKTDAINGNLGKTFHNELTALIKDKQIKHKVVAFKNWNKNIEKYENKYLDRNDDSNSCSGLTKEQEDIEETITDIENCLKHSCIIDSKKKRYIRITRDPEYIIEVLKGNVYIYD